MANDKDSEIQASDAGPLLLEGPKAAAISDTPIIDLEAVRTDTAANEAIAPEQASRWHLPAYAPLAAAIAFAAALGAIAGAAATAGLVHDSSSPVVADAN